MYTGSGSPLESLNANQTRRFWDSRILPQQETDSEEAILPRETREQVRTYLSSSEIQQISVWSTQHRQVKSESASWEAGLRAEGMGSTCVSAQGRPSSLRAVTHPCRTQFSAGMLEWQHLGPKSSQTLSHSDPSTRSREMHHTGPVRGQSARTAAKADASCRDARGGP